MVGRKYFIISVHILILTFTNKTALGKITFVTRFLPSENKAYTYIHFSIEMYTGRIVGLYRLIIWETT